MSVVAMRRVLLVGLLILPVLSAHAADQTVLGRTLVLKNPGAPEKRKVTVTAKETATDDTLVGNPVADGATVTITANGISPSSQTFPMPTGTSAVTGKPFWSGDAVKGFKYKDAKGENGPVKNAQIKIKPGVAVEIKVGIDARGGAVSVIPPNNGTDGCVLFSISAGDSYSVKFASGQVTNAGTVLFRVTKPTAEGTCVTTTTTTTTSTTTTTQCSMASQCPAAPDCQQATCTAGMCGTANVGAGMPAAGQTAGDCQKRVCDGVGGVVSQADNTDVPATSACVTAASCSNGVPAYKFADAEMPCGTGTICDGQGSCVGCLTAGDCGAGKICVASACQGCTVDADCGPGRACVNGACPALRYRDPVFTNVTTTSDIVYDSALDQQGQTVILKLDTYEPTGDTITARPAIVWVHGGSFTGGDKTSPELIDESNTFAKKGYFNASITYRLSPNGCTGSGTPQECVTEINDAMHDAQSAVRFLRANAATYGLDADRIAIGGTSAGAITALDVGYNPDNPGSGNGNPGFSSTVGAAVSLSGAILAGSPSPGDAPALLFHGTADPLVPYVLATNTVNAAHAAGLTAILTTWVGAGHVPYIQHRAEILGQTSTFLYWELDLVNAVQ